jgi:hypothetical protein
MSIVTIQLSIIFAFGLVISGIVMLGVSRAREAAERGVKVTRGAARE